MLWLLYPPPLCSFSFDLEEHKSWNWISPHHKTSCPQERKSSVQRRRTEIFCLVSLLPHHHLWTTSTEAWPHQGTLDHPGLWTRTWKMLFLPVPGVRFLLLSTTPVSATSTLPCCSPSSPAAAGIYRYIPCLFCTVVFGSCTTVSWEKRSNSVSYCKSSAPAEFIWSQEVLHTIRIAWDANGTNQMNYANVNLNLQETKLAAAQMLSFCSVQLMFHIYIRFT